MNMRIYLLVGIIVLSSEVVDNAIVPQCPYGWYPYSNSPNSTSCYLITNKIKRSWSDAQTFCEYMDGTLFKIDSLSERTVVFDMLKWYHAGFPTHTEWWIGLHDNPTQTGVIWIDKTVPTQALLPWDPADAYYDHSKACVEYHNGTLRHQDCSSHQYFICERPLNAAIWCDAVNGWENINNMCYRVNHIPMTWADARSSCQQYNADLFQGKNDADENVLWNFIESRRTDMWIGLKGYQNSAGAVTFRWGGPTGSTIQLGKIGQDYFGISHPDQTVISSNGSVSCVITNHTFTQPKLWQTTDCSIRGFSLCQKTEGRCSAGWIRNSYYCYNFVTSQKLSWTDANAYCNSQGADLLQIRGSSTQSFINSNLADLNQQKLDSIWLGITDYNVDGSGFSIWKFGDNRTFTTFLYNNLPNGTYPVNRPGQMDCLTIYTDDTNGTWQVANNCSETKAFICQLRVGVAPKTPVSPVTTPSPSVTPSTALWSSDCGLFWVKDNTTGYCYRFSDNTLSWFQAQAQCKSLGAGSQLASINTAYEQSFIGDRLFGYQSPALWIGMNDLNSGTGYHWQDGSPFGFLNWSPGEPNNINRHEHCGELVTGGTTRGYWNDVDCNSRRGYICKKPSPDLTTPAPTSLPPTPAGFFYGCPSNLWKPYKGNCYLFMKNHVSWTTANQYCASKGGNLASIVDENEQNFVFSQLPGMIDRSQYWIGFNDMLSQMKFMWSDGSPIHYTNWAENEPNNWLNHNEDCVGIFLKDGTWNDETCENPQSGFVCKAPKALVHTGTPQINLAAGCSNPNAMSLGYYCYTFHQSSKTWAAAQQDCQNMGGNMAVLHDRYQQAFLSAEIAGTGGVYWIGLGNGGAYTSQNWVTGEKVTYTSWSANYTTANNTGSGPPICVAMKTDGPGVGLWINSNCASTHHYICQYPHAGYSTPSTTTPTTPPTCPDGWKLRSGYCYKGFGQSDKKTWFEARNFCEGMGADLVSLHSSDEERFAFSYSVIQSYSYSASFWIGANDFDVEKGYKWTDGTAWNYKNWNRGEPNDISGEDDCVEYNKNGGNWNDQNCYIAKPFVCKVQLGRHISTVPPQVSTTPTPLCAGSSGWYQYNGSCYFISPRYGTDSRKTWYNARKYCMLHGGDLASIHSQQENGFLTSLLSRTVNRNCWLGMTDLGTDQFGWVDGTKFDYVAWSGALEPSDDFGQEKCGQMFFFNGYWNDNDCNEESNFICKRPLGTVHTHTPTPTALIHGGCPRGYTGVHKGNKCYKVIGSQRGDRKNYTDARDDCRAEGGDIASINSHIELVTVINMVNGLYSDDIGLWIGLNDQNRNRRYTWQDSAPLQLTNWAKGQPSYGYRSNCVEMYTNQRRAGQWHNVVCSLNRSYVCEVSRNSTLPTAQPPQGMCPSGYQQTPQLDCLKLHKTSQSWAQAKASCEAERTSLVSVLSVFEQAFVDILTADITTPVWLGLADPQNTGTYSWVDNWGVYYTSWNKDEPSYTAGEGCVATQSGYWNDTVCTNTYPFICKKALFTPPPPTAVPSGYCKDVTWKQFGGSCYYLNLGYNSWSDAERKCKLLGMELTSIVSRNEEQFILHMIDVDPARSRDVWIGFKKNNGFFSWTDGSAPRYINWDSGEPSDLNGTRHEDCVELKHENGKWNDQRCSSGYNGFVCKTAKLPPTSPPPTTTTISTSSQSTASTTISVTNTLPSGFEPISTKPTGHSSSSSTVATRQSQKSSQSLQGSSSPPSSLPSSQSPPPLSSHPTPQSSSLGASPITGTPLAVTPRASQQVEGGTDLSSGQVAGIIIGVMLVLVIACGVLMFLKHHTGAHLFNFRRLRGQPGFDNACYDKSNDEVSISNESAQVNGHASKVTNGNSINMNFTDFHEYDS